MRIKNNAEENRKTKAKASVKAARILSLLLMMCILVTFMPTVPMTAFAGEVISEVNANGFVAPVAGETPQFNISAPAGAKYEIEDSSQYGGQGFMTSYIKWYDQTTSESIYRKHIEDGYKFIAGHTYTARIRYVLKDKENDGWAANSVITAKLNGKTSAEFPGGFIIRSISVNIANGHVDVEYTFPVCGSEALTLTIPDIGSDFANATVMMGLVYQDGTSVASNGVYVTGGSGTITKVEKISGPDWLAVNKKSGLYGYVIEGRRPNIPQPATIMTVKVTDSNDNTAQCTFNVGAVLDDSDTVKEVNANGFVAPVAGETPQFNISAPAGAKYEIEDSSQYGGQGFMTSYIKWYDQTTSESIYRRHIEDGYKFIAGHTYTARIRYVLKDKENDRWAANSVITAKLNGKTSAEFPGGFIIRSISVNVANGHVDVEYTFPEATPPNPLTFADSSDYDIPTGKAGTYIKFFNVKSAVSGGTPGYRFSKESGPDWLTVYPDGTVRGLRPAEPQSETNATIKVTDSSNQTKTIKIIVGKVQPNIKISEVSAAVTEPVVGGNPAAPSAGDTSTYKIDRYTWAEVVNGKEKYLKATDTFEDDKTYRLRVILSTDTYCHLDLDNVTAKINDKDAEIEYKGTNPNDTDYIWYYYDFKVNGPLTFADSEAYDIPGGSTNSFYYAAENPFIATGGTKPYTFTVDPAVQGMRVSADGKVLTYMRPAAVQDATTATIKVTDAAGDSKSITIDVGEVIQGSNTLKFEISPMFGGTGTMDSWTNLSGTVTLPKECTITPFDPEYFAFAGWSDNKMKLNLITEINMDDGDKTVYPYFAMKHQLTVENGTVNGAAAGNYVEGTSGLQLKAVIPEGKEFVNWTEKAGISGGIIADADSAETTYTMPGSDMTITANLREIPTHALTVENGKGGGNYPEGKTVIIEADPAPDGERFKEWTGTGITYASGSKATDSTAQIIMPAKALTVTATYEEAPMRTVTIIDAGTGAIGNGSYEVGDMVVVNPGSRSGYKFNNWTSSGITITDPNSETIYFNMPNNDVTLTANWILISTAGGGGGSPSAGGGGSAGDGAADDTPGTITKPDGTTVTTDKKADGTEVITEKKPDGTETVTEKKTDGSEKVTEKQPDGTKVVTDTDKDGKTTAEVTLPDGKDKADVAIPAPLGDKDGTVTVKVTDKKTGEVKEVKSDYSGGKVSVSVAGDSIIEILDDFVPLAGKMPFVDVKEGDWFYKNVEYVYFNNLMVGTSDTTFSPNAPTTRGMIVTILHRLEGTPAPAGENTFKDVENGKWYTDAVTWAKENGIVSGYSENSFGPNDQITREQMAVIMYNYAKLKGSDITIKGDLSKFGDASSVSGWAKEAMTWAVENGIFNGIGDNLLSPGSNATRAQVAAIMDRYLNK